MFLYMQRTRDAPRYDMSPYVYLTTLMREEKLLRYMCELIIALDNQLMMNN